MVINGKTSQKPKQLTTTEIAKLIKAAQRSYFSAYDQTKPRKDDFVRKGSKTFTGAVADMFGIYGTVLTTLGVVIFSVIRFPPLVYSIMYPEFYRLLGDSWIAVAVAILTAILSPLTADVLIVILSVARATDKTQRSNKFADSVVVLVAIIIVAMGSLLTIKTNPSAWAKIVGGIASLSDIEVMDFILSMALNFSTSVMSVVLGHRIGIELSRTRNLEQKELEEYHKALQRWKEDRLRSWRKDRESWIRQEAKATYGDNVDIGPVLKQLPNLDKQSFGGNLSKGSERQKWATEPKRTEVVEVDPNQLSLIGQSPKRKLDVFSDNSLESVVSRRNTK